MRSPWVLAAPAKEKRWRGQGLSEAQCISALTRQLGWDDQQQHAFFDTIFLLECTSPIL
jgi:hypothetical protein